MAIRNTADAHSIIPQGHILAEKYDTCLFLWMRFVVSASKQLTADFTNRWRLRIGHRLTSSLIVIKVLSVTKQQS
jgi:hypothetical protein